MTSFDVTWRHNQKMVSTCRASSGLSNQCKFILLSKSQGGLQKAPFYRGRIMSQLVRSRVESTRKQPNFIVERKLNIAHCTLPKTHLNIFKVYLCILFSLSIYVNFYSKLQQFMCFGLPLCQVCCKTSQLTDLLYPFLRISCSCITRGRCSTYFCQILTGALSRLSFLVQH